MTKFLCGECIHNSDKGGGCLIPKNLGYVDNCNRYLPKDRPIVQTNEEWFNGLTTEEKAKRIINIAVNSDCDYRTIVEWLKEKHE